MKKCLLHSLKIQKIQNVLHILAQPLKSRRVFLRPRGGWRWGSRRDPRRPRPRRSAERTRTAPCPPCTYALDYQTMTIGISHFAAASFFSTFFLAMFFVSKTAPAFLFSVFLFLVLLQKRSPLIIHSIPAPYVLTRLGTLS